MAITRAKAGALIDGRPNNQGAKLMGKIEIIRHTVAGGQPVTIGQKYDVVVKDADIRKGTITERDAQTLILMKKARIMADAKKETPKPEKSVPVKVENRENDIAETVVKRSKKAKKKK